MQQIRQLKVFFGADLANYNAVFLGNHDALAAGRERICMAAAEAYVALGFERAYVKNPTLFLFGSVDSLLAAGNHLFKALNRMPFYTYINIGLESVDAATLRNIQKPLEIDKIENAFQVMLDVNRSYPNLEITDPIPEAKTLSLDDRIVSEHKTDVCIRNRCNGSVCWRTTSLVRYSST